jgi:hypothetical protein
MRIGGGFAGGCEMTLLLSFLAKPKNQKTLSWLGGGVVVVIGGVWSL